MARQPLWPFQFWQVESHSQILENCSLFFCTTNGRLTAVKNNSDLLLDALNAAGGKLNLWDKSSPEEIKETLSMSKKAFKAAVGVLYKKRLIKINDGSIELV